MLNWKGANSFWIFFFSFFKQSGSFVPFDIIIPGLNGWICIAWKLILFWLFCVFSNLLNDSIESELVPSPSSQLIRIFFLDPTTDISVDSILNGTQLINIQQTPFTASFYSVLFVQRDPESGFRFFFFILIQVQIQIHIHCSHFADFMVMIIACFLFFGR